MLDINILFSLLEKKHIKQSELSKATGISSGNISDWKKGKSYPSAEKLVLIADFLDVSVDYLLGRTDNPNISVDTYINGDNNGIQAISNNNSLLTLTTSESKQINNTTTQLFELVQSLPLLKQAEAIIYLNELKTKK